MKPKVYITREIPYKLKARLEEKYEVTNWNLENVPVPYEVLEEKVTDIDALLCMLTDNIDETLLEKANNLKVISTMSVGYDNIDVKKANELNIVVTNTPGVLTETTADLTFSLMMASARRLVEASEYLKNGKWRSWSPMLLTGQEIHGATLGIIGMGRIGEAITKRARGFNMDVIYYNRNRKPQVEKELLCRYTGFKELLEKSDFIIIMTPYTSETKNLITEKEFKLMKNNAILINTSRGGIVNEMDLYHALKSKEILGAGLDVFEDEPIAMNHPLLTLSNIILLPHIGSASVATRVKMGEIAVSNIIEVLNRIVPKNKVFNKYE